MKHLLKLSIGLLLTLLILAACGASPREANYEMPAAPMATVVVEKSVQMAEDTAGYQGEGRVATTTDLLQEERKVIYNASLTLVVKDPEEAAKQVEDLVAATGGYIANMNAYRNSDGLLFYNITLRVPVSGFNSIRDALRNLAVRVENDSINTDDVTDQYYDLEARLRTLRATEEELLSLLKETRERGGKVEDIMTIYRELTNIQSQIESLQGQLNRLDKLTALSTITVELRPDELTKPIKTSWRPLETLRNSFRILINVLQGLVDVLIYLIVVAVPTLIILAIPILIALFILRWFIRKLRNRKPKSDA
ncbi:MAG: DUF4349 domain-containing protein [Chloroflexi bacterium]|nr:DUF4349 domain-containing protein [Chloroflexota bacterium]